MADVFISYASTDSKFAAQLHAMLSGAGVNTFMAELSLESGAKWSEQIANNLRSAKWVLFLASRAAIASPAVQQELGAAVFSKKALIPVLWDIPPEDLPAWVKEYQAVDIRGGNVQALQPIFNKIASTVRSNDFMAGVIVATLVFGLLYMLTSK